MKLTGDVSQIQKPLKAIIGIVVLLAIALIVFGGDDEAPNESAESVLVAKEETKENKISDLSLYFDCKPKIQEQLNNPKSFDPVATSLKYNFVDNQHIVGFDFYAENGFGGEVMQQAVCSFDADSNILKYGVV